MKDFLCAVQISRISCSDVNTDITQHEILSLHMVRDLARMSLKRKNLNLNSLYISNLLSGATTTKTTVNTQHQVQQQDDKSNILGKKTYKHYKPQYRYDPQVPINLSTKQALQSNPSGTGTTTELETLDLSLKKALDGNDQQQRPSVLVSSGTAQLQEEPMDFSTKTPATPVVPQSPQTTQLTHQPSQAVHQLQSQQPQTVNQIATVQSQSVQLQQQQQQKQQQQQPLQTLQVHVQQAAAPAQTQLATAGVQPQQTLQQIILQQPSAQQQQQQQQPQLCISTPQQIQQLASQLQSSQVKMACFVFLTNLVHPD